MITYKVQRVTDPDVEPVTLVQAKAHLNVDHDLDDDLIEAYISAARDQSERYCNRAFAMADFLLLLRSLPAGTAPIPLPDPGTKSVESITYLDETGTEVTIPDTEYTVDVIRQQIRPATAWPIYGSSVVVRYTAGPDGSASPAETPPKTILQAILLLLADMYELREAQVVGTSVAQNPAAAVRLSLYRVDMGA